MMVDGRPPILYRNGTINHLISLCSINQPDMGSGLLVESIIFPTCHPRGEITYTVTVESLRCLNRKFKPCALYWRRLNLSNSRVASPMQYPRTDIIPLRIPLRIRYSVRTATVPIFQLTENYSMLQFTVSNTCFKTRS
jgi:hypothetical protein